MHDPRHLLSFTEVMETGSFTAAARSRGVTVAAISRSVAQLERDLGVQLLQRTTRRLAATDQGKAFYDRVRIALTMLKEADDAARSLTQQVGGTLRVATPNAFGRHYLLPRLAEFHSAYPSVTVELYFDDYVGNVIEHGFDIVIQHGIPKNMGFITRKLMRMPIVLAASPQYLHLHGVPRSVDDLYHHRCIVVRFGDGRAFNWYLEPRDIKGAHPIIFRPEGSTHIFNSLDANLFAALSGLGIASIDAASGHSYFTSGRLKILLPEYSLHDGRDSTTLHLIYPQREYLPQRIRQFIDFAVQIAKESETNAPDLSAFYG